MPNNLQGVSADIIAQESLAFLRPFLSPLRYVCTDFSSDIADGGETVTTRIPGKVTFTQNIGAAGYAASAQDVSTVPVKIELGDVSGLVLKFTDKEMSTSSIGDLRRLFIEPGSFAMAQGLQNALFGLVNETNFPTAFAAAKADFDSDVMADLAEMASNMEWQPFARAGILSPTYFAALSKDPSIKAAYAYGDSTVIREHKIPSVHSFNPMLEIVGLPTGVKGMVLLPQAIAMAARSPMLPDNFPGEIAEAKDEETGFSFQVRKWYSPDLGRWFLSMGTMWGASKGLSNALIRIVEPVTPAP